MTALQQKNPLAVSRQFYLLNLPFLVGLILLILNDHYFKGAYGNGLTGKLSDFAGVLILPLFLKFLFNRSNALSIIMTLLLFLFWKSPYSSTFIEYYNLISPISIYRVIDYTDYWAFIMLPLSYHILENIKSYSLNISHQPNWLSPLLFTTALFSFIATSVESNHYRDKSEITFCCSSYPEVLRVGSGNIFIPSIFTPDGNGVNDMFQVVADSSIAKIDSIKIFDPAARALVFFQENITDINQSTGWDGVYNDTIVPAQYEYRIYVTSVDSFKRTFSGYVCCIPCASPTGMLTPLNIEVCGFATQYDANMGVFDSNTPSLEDMDCFE